MNLPARTTDAAPRPADGSAAARSGEACPYCGATDSRPGPSRSGAQYRVCLSCASGFVPEPPIDFRDYYEAYDPTAVLDLADVVRTRYAAVLSSLEARGPGRRLLEVGCGNGHFLAVAAGRGWTASGVELSRAHVERARAAELDVRYGDLHDDDLWGGETFDAVVLIEVLEHVPQPTTLLAAVTERLVPGGATYLTTPNFGSVSRRLLGSRWSVLDPEHVALASAAGLRSAFARAGQTVVRLRSKNLYLGEYRRLWSSTERRDRGGAARHGDDPDAGAPPSPSRAEAAAALRDRIEASRALRAAKAAANVVLGLTGLGESLECLAARPGGRA